MSKTRWKPGSKFIRHIGCCRVLLLSLLLLLPLQAFAQLTFSKGACCSGSWQGAAFADLRLSNFDDMVTFDANGNVVVYLNDKHGHLISPGMSTPSGFHSISTIAVGDSTTGINAVVVGEASSNHIALLVGRGDGTFDPPQIFTFGTRATDAANAIVVQFLSSNFSGPDIAFSTDKAGIYVMKNQGSSYSQPVLIQAGDYRFLRTGFLSKGSDLAAIGVRDSGGKLVRDVVEFKNGGNYNFVKSVVETGTAIGLEIGNLDNGALDDLIVPYVGNPSGVSLIYNNQDGTTFKTGFVVPDKDPATGAPQTLVGATVGYFNEDGQLGVGAAVNGDGVQSQDKFIYVLGAGTPTPTPTGSSTRLFSALHTLDLGFDNQMMLPRSDDLSGGPYYGNRPGSEVIIGSVSHDDFLVLYPQITRAGDCPAPATPGVHLCYNPLWGVSFVSPTQIIAAGTGASGSVNHMELWADGRKINNYPGDLIDAPVALTPGKHVLTAIEVDSKGAFAKSEPWFLTIDRTSSTGPCSPPSAPGVNVCSPSSQCSIDGNYQVLAAGTGASGRVDHMELWAAGVKIANFPGNRIDSNFIFFGGYLTIIEVDSKGAYIKSPRILNTGGC
jgi:hypothetical protein